MKTLVARKKNCLIKIESTCSAAANEGAWDYNNTIIIIITSVSPKRHSAILCKVDKIYCDYFSHLIDQKSLSIFLI